MSRRSLFYVVNLIFPCLLIYAVSFLGFFLPSESGDKINLEITVLLALVVFLLIAGETLPPTPDSLPALGLLFGLTMLMVSIALVMAVVVTNIYFRKDSMQTVPHLVRRIFLGQPSTSSSPYSYRRCPVRGAVGLEPTSAGSRRRGSGPTTGKQPRSRRSDPASDERRTSLTNAEKEEWQRLAKAVDRLFFWIFFFISIGCLMAMYIRIPP